MDIGFILKDRHSSEILVCHSNLPPDVLSGNGLTQNYELRF